MDVVAPESRCASPQAAAIGRAAHIATVATPGDDVARPLWSLERLSSLRTLAKLAQQIQVFWRGIAKCKSDRYG